MVVETALKALPVVFQSFSFVDIAKNVSNISDPISASIAASKLVVGACSSTATQNW
jgi:hypothetical protein